MDKISISAIEKMQMPETTALLGQAFSTNPINVAVFGNNNVSGNERYFSLALRNMLGLTFVAQSEGAIIGVVCIVKYPQCAPTKMKLLKQIPKLLLVAKSATPRVLKWESAWGSLHPRESHYHFGPVAVLPKYQHHHIGTKMMEYCCMILDRENEAGYLETDRAENINFYGKFGFKVIGELNVLGVPNWFMKRSPASGSQSHEEYSC